MTLDEAKRTLTEAVNKNLPLFENLDLTASGEVTLLKSDNLPTSNPDEAAHLAAYIEVKAGDDGKPLTADALIDVRRGEVDDAEFAGELDFITGECETLANELAEADDIKARVEALAKEQAERSERAAREAAAAAYPLKKMLSTAAVMLAVCGIIFIIYLLTK